MAKPRFRLAVERVARPVLEPMGFVFCKEDAPGYGLYSFLKPWKGGLNHGVGLQGGIRERAFAVELGVVHDDYWLATVGTFGRWRVVGVRERLGTVVHKQNPKIERFDLIPYVEQHDLEAALRTAMEQVVTYGPTWWDSMSRRILRKR